MVNWQAWRNDSHFHLHSSMVQVCCCEHTALNMPSVEISSLLCMQGSVICAAPQHLEEADECFGVSEAELNSHAISLEAQVGRLIAEAANLEDENCWMNAQLKDTQSDKWYLEIAKTGLEDRVAHLAAALVQACTAPKCHHRL
jgi:hypothetical protein